MPRPRKFRRRLKSAILPALCLAAIAYFGYHAVYGSYGLLAYGEYKARESRLNAQLEQLVEHRNAIEQQVTLMRPDNLDPDMLDEQARKNLGFSHPDDLIILLPSR